MSANWFNQKPDVSSQSCSENIQSYFNRNVDAPHLALTFVRKGVKEISLSGQTYTAPLGQGVKCVFDHLRNYDITDIQGNITIGFPFSSEPLGKGNPFKRFTPVQVLKKQDEIFTPAKLGKIERDLIRMNSVVQDGIFILGDHIYIVIGYHWWSTCVHLHFIT